MSSHSKKYGKITTNQKVAGSNPAGATIEMQTPQRIAVFFYFPGNKCQFGMGNIWGRF